MENFGWKGLFTTIWQRVVLSFGTTLVGLALVLADGAISYLGNVNLPTWLHALVGLAASLLAFYKSKNVAPAAAVKGT